VLSRLSGPREEGEGRKKFSFASLSSRRGEGGGREERIPKRQPFFFGPGSRRKKERKDRDSISRLKLEGRRKKEKDANSCRHHPPSHLVGKEKFQALNVPPLERGEEKEKKAMKRSLSLPSFAEKEGSGGNLILGPPGRKRGKIPVLLPMVWGKMRDFRKGKGKKRGGRKPSNTKENSDF